MTKIHDEDTVVCARCKSEVRIVMMDKAAILEGCKDLGWTGIDVIRRRTRRGDRFGLLIRVVWLCPGCGQAHERKEWTPDDQMMLPGWNWR